MILKRLWEQFGSLETAWYMPANELLKVDGIGLLSVEKIVATRAKLDPDKLLAEHEQKNQAFWTPADPDYPALLFAINDPPPVLYYRGQLRLNNTPQLTVGMVGTRRPSAYGKRWTQRISRYLSERGIVIVSGLAAGIDTEAHTSCLQQQGLTVAVLGTGVDVAYPQRNQPLQAQIEATGLVVSEYPDGTGPDKAHFPRRNRIIAGLSRATLVTEAPARSGALITARLANDYCREVYALPCSLDNLQGSGCLEQINQGAQMILSEQMLFEAFAEMPDVAVLWPGAPVSKQQTTGQVIAQANKPNADVDATHTRNSKPITATSTEPAPDLSPSLAQVLKAVGIEPMVLDQIVQDAQVETGQALAALVQLELLGLVTQLPGMQYQRAETAPAVV